MWEFVNCIREQVTINAHFIRKIGGKIMLFWLCLIILIVGIGLVAVGKMEWFDTRNENKLRKFLYQNDDTIECSGWATVVVSGFIMAIMIVVFACNYIGVNAQVEKAKEQYNAITYKVESGACRDEFGLLNKEVIDEIQDWNEDITYYKNLHKDFWVGIFVPNVYDQFETIDYTKYGRE